MKKIIILFILGATCLTGRAQGNSSGKLGADFPKYIGNAKEAFRKNDLEDTRYNLMLSMQQLDMKVGEEILKILPEKMDSMALSKNFDNVMATSGFIGTSIHREYGVTQQNKVEVDIITNSPLVGSLNAWLNNPMMANMGGRKAMKVDGYKGSYTYEVRDETDNSGNQVKRPYAEMQIPVFSSLITVKCSNMNEDAFVKMLNTVPVSKIAEMVK
ncbi:MAG TPA: hypothetical protein VK166_02135 [Chitinophagaceae bacterium]|nr:hypothetical protein [Chitinophagaceae bacterium]